MRREDVLLNLRAMGLERQADEDWEKPDVDWPGLTSEGSRERGLVADYIFQNHKSPDSLCSSRLNQKVRPRSLSSPKAVFGDHPGEHHASK